MNEKYAVVLWFTERVGPAPRQNPKPISQQFSADAPLSTVYTWKLGVEKRQGQIAERMELHPVTGQKETK